VSPQPLQRGAKKVAVAASIRSVRLTSDSTEAQWLAELEDVAIFGIKDEANVSIRESLTIREFEADGTLVKEHNVKIHR
jgi:hypothetical protein